MRGTVRGCSVQSADDDSFLREAFDGSASVVFVEWSPERFLGVCDHDCVADAKVVRGSGLAGGSVGPGVPFPCAGNGNPSYEGRML